MKILGLIPARGGSKGVPGKNIRIMGGKPLLQYTAEAALAAKRLSRVILSTDDTEIADVGRYCGIDVPFLRPEELAVDKAPTLPLIQHAIKFLESENEFYDAVCLLQPTNPLRRSIDIDDCIKLLETTGADSVISVLSIPKEYNPFWAYKLNEQGGLELFSGEDKPVARRQDLPEALHRDGSVYLTRTEIILKEHSLYGSKIIGFRSDPQFSVNIDTEDDWQSAADRICP